MKKSSGFTLIEMLVAMAVLGTLVVIGSNMFFTILKSSSKTRVLTEVKQNGDFALNVMSRMIRNAKLITSSCNGGMSSLSIKNPDNGETTFACEADNDKISSSAARLTSENVSLVAGSCWFDCLSGESGVTPDTVTINFSLQQAAQAVRPEETARVNFQTTVTLRNY
jgi:prepilin-type N-terminal cleavage/methylation domain-containing protein